MLYCVSTDTRPRRLRGSDGNAWRAGFWPAGRMLDTLGFYSVQIWSRAMAWFIAQRFVPHCLGSKIAPDGPGQGQWHINQWAIDHTIAEMSSSYVFCYIIRNVGLHKSHCTIATIKHFHAEISKSSFRSNFDIRGANTVRLHFSVFHFLTWKRHSLAFLPCSSSH